MIDFPNRFAWPCWRPTSVKGLKTVGLHGPSGPRRPA